LGTVVSFPGSSADVLGVASTSPGGALIPGSRSEVWLCPAFSGSDGVVLYVKPFLSTRRVMIEILAAIVGQCIGLPCPRPFLVTCSPHHVGRVPGKKLIAFGSEQVGTRALARTFANPEAMIQALEKQRVLDTLFVFDEWIANPVRGPRDAVLDPEHGVMLIDHEGAMEELTKSDQAVTNWLADRVLATTAADSRHLLLKRVRAKAQLAQNAQIGLIPSAVQFDQDGVSTYRTLLEFLWARLTHLDRLLTTRILPNQGYLTETPEADAAS
jgi:hypothetical protein